MVFHSLEVCHYNLRYCFFFFSIVNVLTEIVIWYCFHHDTTIQRKKKKKRRKKEKCQRHKITGLPSCWFYFAGIVKPGWDPSLGLSSKISYTVCTKTIYQDYNNLLKCLCIPFMQLVINFRFYSHRWAKATGNGIALVHVVTIGLGQIFIEDCKPFFL